MNNSINAANIGLAPRRQRPSKEVAATTRSQDSVIDDQRPSRSADGSNTPRRDRRSATVSWYGKLLIVSVLVMGAAWEVFKWIAAIITLD